MREHATDQLQILPFLSAYNQPKMFQTCEIITPVNCSIHMKRYIAGRLKSQRKGGSHASVKYQPKTRGEEEQAGEVVKRP